MIKKKHNSRATVSTLVKYFTSADEVNLSTIKSDILAGVAVSLVLIPQALAYAQLAGLPAHYGLYAALLPPIIAALLGSSRQLSTGPVAVISLLTATALGKVAIVSSNEYILYAAMVAFVLGVIQIAMGLFRLGSLSTLISHPVVYGFTNAAALVIASTQLSKFFGVSVGDMPHQYQTVIAILTAALEHTHWPTLVMGITALLGLFVLRKINKRLPYILIVVVAATFISWVGAYQVQTKINIGNIESQQVKDQIARYNIILENVRQLQSQVYALKEKLDQESPASKTAINTSNTLRTVEYDLSNSEEELSLVKSALQLTYLYQTDSFQQQFYDESELGGSPNRIEAWRIKVPTNQPIDDSKIVVTLGGAIVGAIPQGLPKFALPQIDISVIGSLLPAILVMALIAFAEVVSVSQAIAIKTKQRLNTNQELIGQGAANIASGLSLGYPVAGSFSRTAVNFQTGAQTALSSVVTGLMVLLVLLFFTKTLYFLPQVVLAAVIVFSVVNLIDLKRLTTIFKTSFSDGIAALITMLATLYFAPDLEKGIFIGITFSVVYYFYRTARPRVVFLSKYRDGSFHDSELFHLARCQNVAVLRFDAPLFFANAENLENAVINDLVKHPQIKRVLIVGTGINDIDATGEEVLASLVEMLRGAKKDLYFCSLKPQVFNVLVRTGFVEEIGEDHVFATTKEAVLIITKTMHKHTDANGCPLRRYIQMQPEGTHRAKNHHLGLSHMLGRLNR